ncbi:MAG: class I SAM-dependent methyltransferase [Deltaproteobacteria bacterium]|nr:class I SAM-dependent methyltransferase [Deltaproteobacteria bacterium]
MWEATFEELCSFADGAGLDARSFLQRRAEFEVLFHHVPVPAGSTLEVGCGGGFLTALLAREGKLAVGIDMAAPDDLTHSRGLEAPGRLARTLRAPNLRFLGCSGESLCFNDGSFDLVLSSYVLEHVPDRPRAVREMKRVTRPDGLIIALVPGWMERVYAPFNYYFILIWGTLRSAYRFLAQRIGRAPARDAAPRPGAEAAGSAAAPAPEEGVGDKIRKFFRVYHPTFPFPRPHGYYRSSSEELRAHRYRRWRRLFEAEGLVVERAFVTRIAPTCLLEMISDGADRAAQGALAGTLRRHGESRWARAVAYSWCFVLRKGDDAPAAGEAGKD